MKNPPPYTAENARKVREGCDVVLVPSPDGGACDVRPMTEHEQKKWLEKLARKHEKFEKKLKEARQRSHRLAGNLEALARDPDADYDPDDEYDNHYERMSRDELKTLTVHELDALLAEFDQALAEMKPAEYLDSLPTDPTDVLPGSKEKVTVYRERATLRQALNHPEDVQMRRFDGSAGLALLIKVNRNGSKTVVGIVSIRGSDDPAPDGGQAA